ncbi:hypothetical protein LY78DRAFT_548021, partial [Colletotrichum sublineola]
DTELASDAVLASEVAESDEAVVPEVLVPVRFVVEVDSLKLLDSVAAVVSGVVVDVDVLSSDEVAEVVADELTLNEKLREVEESVSDEVLLLPVELTKLVDVVKLLGSVEEVNSEDVLKSDEMLGSVEVLEAVEKLVSLELLRSVELEVTGAVVLESREELDLNVDVAV